MKTIAFIAVGAVVLIFALFIYSLCRMSGKSDEQMEKLMKEKEAENELN